MAKYRLDSIEPRKDGSGEVKYAVWALDDEGAVIPGKHKDVLVPGDEVAAAEALPTTGEKNAEHKRLLIEYAGPGWDSDTLDEAVLANQEAAEAAAAVNERLDLPVVFNL